MMMMTRKICIKIITLLKDLEFCLPSDYSLRKYVLFQFQGLLSNLMQTSISKTCLKAQLQHGVKFTCYRLQQRFILPCVLFNTKLSIMKSFSIKNYTFRITRTVLCSFGKTLAETPIHIFYDRLQTKLHNEILTSLTPQVAILGITNEENNIYSLLNPI